MLHKQVIPNTAARQLHIVLEMYSEVNKHNTPTPIKSGQIFFEKCFKNPLKANHIQYLHNLQTDSLFAAD